MVRISNGRLDYLVTEDLPYVDLTTEVLGIGKKPGRMTYFTREAGVLCGTEEAARICQELGNVVVSQKPSGTRLQPGEDFLTVEGPAEALHAAWKVCLNLFDHLSAVATKADTFVRKVKAAGPNVEVLTTRKSMPGTKDLITKAVMTGGAFPHRLGLSETVLVFDNHIKFMGGFEEFLKQVPELRARCIEKKLFVEVTADQALAAVKAGVDGVQLDKADPQTIANLVPQLRQVNPRVAIIAAGGVNMQNCEAYAATGIDGIATTCLFTAPPLDMSVRMEALEG